MTTITEHADNYLAGYGNVPIGVLDSPEFKAEVRRLAGGPTPEQQRVYLEKLTTRLEKVLRPLYGPRGGLAKKYRYIEFQYHLAKGELETLV